ncbi:MAG: branched-chain amino acid ABC transporter permease [Burkholderiales bacterium]|nr:branched-chain amino acid ABC transporter permease [Burkholderiales bacterium]
MNFDIALLLAQDGLTNGAIYALLALALVLVFAVTRVIFVPQGEFVAYGALTLASLQLGKVPGTAYLLIVAGVATAAVETLAALRERRPGRLPALLAWNVALPVALLLAARWAAPLAPPLWAQVALALALVVPLGPMLYRLAFQPLANASVLVLLIVSVAVHFVMVGLGLLFFGAEGSRTPAFSDARFAVGAMTVSGQSLFVIGASLALIFALWLFFERTLYGKALRATAVNRLGARLVGISTTLAGKLTFTLAAAIGAASGILVAPITTIYYDSGFLIGLKGFVGAIIGGLVSYPLAAAGALVVGLLESFSSFWASAFKEVIVFTLIIPVLLWRSLTTHHVEEEEDE